MTDWLEVAKDRDETAQLRNDDGPVIAAALIAIAEELRQRREQPEIVPITVYVNAENAGPEQIREVAKHIDDQIKRRRR